MSRDLRRDIYNLKELGFAIEDVIQPVPGLSASFRYSCIYWIDHLTDSELVTSSADLIDAFLRSKYVYWLEALSLCKHVPRGVTSIAKLRTALQVILSHLLHFIIYASQEQATEGSTILRELVYDAHRFSMYHRAVIEDQPLQVYASALLFSPAKSISRDLFRHEEPDWATVKPAMSDTWNAYLQTIEGATSFGSHFRTTLPC